MFIKTRLILTALFAILGLVATSSLAAENKNMPQECQQLFSETEQLIKEVEKQPGTHPQISQIKQKLNQSKEKILALDTQIQAKSCEQGLAKLARFRLQDETQ
ncbi:MAG: DUF5339 domain-containing protein [Lonepinella koalarum]|nr:DUF5339 domain-containing protein [Lonepinella koalarum]